MKPPVPSGLDLRDFQYMPLDVVRLVDSDLSAISTGDEFKAAVTLWCKSWHQIPAASLPDDDRMLAHLAGFGRDVKEWKRVRDVALRGFVKCDDGRLYHPVIAEKAIDAAESKREHREAREAENIRKQREREDRSRMFDLLRAAGVTPAWNTATSKLRELVTDLSRVTGVTGEGQERDSHTPVTPPVTPDVTANKGEGEGKGREREREERAREDARAQAKPDLQGKPDPEHWATVQALIEHRPADDLDEWEINFLHTIRWRETLTKAQRDSLSAIQAKTAPPPAATSTEPPRKTVAVMENSKAWEAWKATGRRFNPIDIRDDQGRVVGRGWYFPSEFPPGSNSEAA